jgi:WD40 repeat protein
MVGRGPAVAVNLLLLSGCSSDNASPTRCPDVACLERALVGHGSRVTSVAFSPDGQTVASGSTDFSVRLWKTADGALERTLTGHTSSVLSLAFSPDGVLLASGSEDSTTRLWSTADGRLVRRLSGAIYGVTAVAFSRDGRTLLAGSADHSVRLWDVATGRLVATVAAHVAPVTAVALAPDGARFASAAGTLDGRVRLWTFPAATPVWQAFGDTAVWSLAFAPDGSTLACGGSAGAVPLRATADGRELRILAAGDGPVNAVAYSPDGQNLVASEGASVRVFDPTAGESRGLLTGHAGTVFALAFSPDGGLLASASDDATVRRWSFF